MNKLLGPEEKCDRELREMKGQLYEGMYAEVVSLVVSGNHRRLGIGVSLIKEAENWAKKYVHKIRVRANTIRIQAR